MSQVFKEHEMKNNIQYAVMFLSIMDFISVFMATSNLP